MSVETIEGIVHNGRIQLPPSVHLPENAKVYVVIPDGKAATRVPYIGSPRLVNPKLAGDFQKTISAEQA
jgi:hypothetical protein